MTPPCILTGWKGWELSGVFFKGTDPTCESSALMTQLLLMAPPPNTITFGVRISTYEPQGAGGGGGEVAAVKTPRRTQVLPRNIFFSLILSQ